MTELELTRPQTDLHQTALRLSRKHRELEARLCECLRKIDQTKLFKKLGHPSLFVYATCELGLTEAIAYAFISVARKSNEIPELKAAVESKALTVAKASRLVSALTAKNADEIIAFAQSHSARELEAELVRRYPERRRPDRVRPVDADTVELRARLPKSANQKLERVRALLAQKGKCTDLATALEAALDEYLNRHDPIEKAKRAKRRRQHKQPAPDTNATLHQDFALSGRPELSSPKVFLRTRRVCSGNQGARGLCKTSAPALRRPFSASEKHTVFLRDQGRCTFVNERGERCNADRWLHIHHIKAVSHGGTNDSSNLTTLCSFHHDLVHQLSFPLEGEINWLRAPTVEYVA